MIRILTLLVSLFTFGLVDLAEITYEIPVTDMLYFNDTPIEELNDLTLNEVFRDGNLVLNHDFSNGTTNWISFRSTFIVSDNTATFIGTSGANQGIFQSFTSSGTNSWFLVSDVKTTSNLVRLDRGSSSSVEGQNINHSGSGNFETLSILFTTNAQVSLTIRDFRTIDWDNVFVKNTYAINLTTLGLTSLTKAQLDRYYELWLNPELNITYEINTLDIQDLIILLASQSVWTITIHLLYKYAYRPKKKSKRLGM